MLHMQRTFVDEGWFSVLVASQQVLLWMKLVSGHASGTHGFAFADRWRWTPPPLSDCPRAGAVAAGTLIEGCICESSSTAIQALLMVVFAAACASAIAVVQHYFAKAFNPTKNTIVDTIRIVVEDMKARHLLAQQGWQYVWNQQSPE